MNWLLFILHSDICSLYLDTNQSHSEYEEATVLAELSSFANNALCCWKKRTIHNFYVIRAQGQRCELSCISERWYK